MAEKPDIVQIAAKTLADISVAGGAVYATSIGIDPYTASMGSAALRGMCEFVIASFGSRPDPKNVLARIRDERTAQTVDTIRDVLVEAMELKPEFREPIEELADAVQASEDGRDEKRFRTALLNLYVSVAQVTGKLDDIKADTANLPDIHRIVKDNQERLKSIETTLVKAEHLGGIDHRLPQFLAARVESLTDHVRDLLDVEAKAKWDQISNTLSERSWQEAFELAKEMEEWLNQQTDKISPEVKIQGLLTLVDVAVVRDSGLPFEDRVDLSDARRLLDKAETVATANISEETANRLLRVRAKLTYIDGHHSQAHEILDQLDDPGAISLKLGTMEEEGKWSDASDLAHAQSEPHRRWAASAVTAHINASQIQRADDILEWAESQEPRIKKSCALSYVKSRYTAIISDEMGEPLQVLTEPDLEILNTLHAILADKFVGVFAEGPTSGIDAEALEMEILLGHFLRQADVCERASSQLVKWKPVSPELGRAVLRGDISPVDGLADRFIEEYDDVLSPRMLAAMLLIEVDSDAERALSLLLPKLTAVNRDQREEIATTVLIGAQYCTAESLQDAYQKVSDVLGCKHRLAIMLNAVLLAKKHSIGEARSLIESLSDKDDHIWLQLAASLATQQSAWGDAANYLHRLSELTGHADAYRQEAEAWYRADEIPKCIVPLENAHKLLPDDITVTHTLAEVYHRIERYADAASIYDSIWNEEPHTRSLALNFANALVLSGDVPKAIAVLKEYITSSAADADLISLLTCARLMHTQNDAAGAISLLLPHWDRFDSDHRYLMAVLHLGYAANREQDANKALQALTDMLNRGALPEGVIWKVSIDEIRNEFKAAPERRRFINEQYRSGRLPWIIASNWAQPSNHSYVSWLIRTQPLVFSDNPNSIAESSIYSTNGFTAGQIGEERQLLKIIAPSKGSKIVADISALITLHRLGLLELACTYFEIVYLPQSYRSAWIEEQGKIPHRQPSQIQSQKAILHAVEKGRLRIAGDEQASTPRLDECEKDTSEKLVIVRILQLVKWLATKGLLSSSQRIAVEAKYNESALIPDDEANKIFEAGVVVADLGTLQALHRLELLDEVCGGIHIYIENTDLNTVRNELRNQEMRDQAGGWYRDLVSIVERIPNVEFVRVEASPIDSSQDDDDDGEDSNSDDEDRLMIHFGIDSAHIAMKLGHPLLADDRCCQQGLLNQKADKLDAAFGTDVLLAALEADSQLSVSQHVAHLIQLIRWRYKFILPSATVLCDMAVQYIEGLPGADLREVAEYMQDCMRDTGLYGGPEQVQPPFSMATKLFTTWVNRVAEFIVMLWWDERISEDKSSKLTNWAIRYFLPAWPRNTVSNSWRQAASNRRRTLLGSLVVHLMPKEDVHKAHCLISCVNDAIHFTEEELAFGAITTSEVLLSEAAKDNDVIKRGLFSYVLQVFYGTEGTVPWRLLPTAQQAGVIDPTNLPPMAADDDVAVLRNRQHEKRMEPTFGPFAYIREQKNHAVVTYLPEALCSHQVNVRDATLENLLPEDFCPKTELTRKALEGAADDIGTDIVGRWVPAVGRVLEPLHEDFILNLAGFRQSDQRKYEDGSKRCWSHLIRPTPEALLAIDRDGWKQLPLDDNPEDNISAMCNASMTVDKLLSCYDEIAGHMALATPLDLGTQLQQLRIRTSVDSDVWSQLNTWLTDAYRPWRQYHACQALLVNPQLIPKDCLENFWGHVVRIVGLLHSGG